MNKLKFIKFIVFILTFLLVFGLLLAMGTIYKKASRKQTKTDLSLNLPTHSHITDWHIDNGNIYLLIKNGKHSEQIIVVDQATNSVTATIKINKE